jgi:hypothetical protein
MDQSCGGGLIPVGGERRWKGLGRVNIVLILCTHVRKWTNDNC